LNPDLFHDYYRGLSQRELEKKYDMPIRTITWQCKGAMSYLFNASGTIINENIKLIKQEVANL
jgi:hypothetical protein